MKVERRDLSACSRDAGWKKLKTISAACEGPPATEKSMIDMTSSNGKRNEAARYAPSAEVYTKTSVESQVCSHLEKLAIIKSNEMDYVAKVAPRPTSSTTETDSPAGKEETACVGSCEKSTKRASGEADEICVLLRPYLLEDIDACAKFIDGVRKVCLPKFLCEAYDTI